MTTIDRIKRLLKAATSDNIYSPGGTETVNAFGVYVASANRDQELTNETVLAIRKLFYESDPAEQPDLAYSIAQGVEAYNTDIVAALIVELEIAHALYALTGDKRRQEMLAHALASALLYRPRFPRQSELDTLAKWNEAFIGSPVKYKLAHAITAVEAFQLRGEVLRGANPAVDRDRRELSDRLVRLTVPQDVRDLLAGADRDADGGDFKGGLEKLRTFLERTCEHCCRIAATQTAAAIPEDKAGGNIAPWKALAMSLQLLTKHEADVVHALSSFLAMAGSHAPRSRPEQYSVARTTVVEWCLLLSGRVPPRAR